MPYLTKDIVISPMEILTLIQSILGMSKRGPEEGWLAFWLPLKPNWVKKTHSASEVLILPVAPVQHYHRRMSRFDPVRWSVQAQVPGVLWRSAAIRAVWDVPISGSHPAGELQSHQVGIRFVVSLSLSLSIPLSLCLPRSL